MLARLRRETFDVVVIGGGITGVGVALDAAARGLRTALVERDDFSSGTSSRSSKLVHGGLRYLQNGDVRLVYEALHERQRLLRNAPHLVSVLPFMIPILTRDGVVSRKISKALGSAMWMYDVTGGWRIGKRHRRLDADAAFAHLPTMARDRLSGAFVYYDAHTDDARLTLAVARTAAAHGAVVVNRCSVVDLTHDAHGTVNGVVVRAGGTDPADGGDEDGDDTFRVDASVVVSATGVWSDRIRALEHPDPSPTIRPAKGVHLTVPWEKVRNDIAVVIPVPKDKRSLFVVPWGPRGDGTFRYAYVGTTDTDHDGSIDDPQCTATDADYVLGALNASITTDVTPDDVTGVWAGLRPLVADTGAGVTDRTADLSRHHHLSVSDTGVIGITGGKLTTYRVMAADTVDEVLRRLGRPPRRRIRAGIARLARRGSSIGPRSGTRRLRLLGATGDLGDPSTRNGHLRRRYGTQAADVLALIAVDPSLAEPLVVGHPHLRAEAVFAVRHEMATTVTDVLVRRTRVHLMDRDAAEAAAGDVARLLAGELGWDDAETERQVDAYRSLCARERAAAEHDAAHGAGSGTRFDSRQASPA